MTSAEKKGQKQYLSLRKHAYTFISEVIL